MKTKIFHLSKLTNIPYFLFKLLTKTFLKKIHQDENLSKFLSVLYKKNSIRPKLKKKKIFRTETIKFAYFKNFSLSEEVHFEAKTDRTLKQHATSAACANVRRVSYTEGWNFLIFFIYFTENCPLSMRILMAIVLGPKSLFVLVFRPFFVLDNIFWFSFVGWNSLL